MGSAKMGQANANDATGREGSHDQKHGCNTHASVAMQRLERLHAQKQM